MARKITRRPWNLRRGDLLEDGRIVANVSYGIVIMLNGPALWFDGDSPSVTVYRQA